MSPNLNSYERLVRFVLGALLLFAAAVLFQHPLARLIAGLGGLFSLVEAVASRCWLMSWLGIKTTTDALKPETRNLIGLLAIQFVIAYEWWSAGWEKVSSSEFVEGIVGSLGYFASANPFPWYKDFLLGFATQNAAMFAYAVELSEIGIALALAIASWWHLYAKSEAHKRLSIILMIPALFGGLLMNANYYLAAGWTSPGTHGVNLVMFWTQAILLYVWLSKLHFWPTAKDRARK